MKHLFKSLSFVLFLTIFLYFVSSPIRAAAESSSATSVNNILLLQQYLKQKGYFPAGNEPTGEFDAMTLRAIVDWQKSNRVSAADLWQILNRMKSSGPVTQPTTPPVTPPASPTVPSVPPAAPTHTPATPTPPAPTPTPKPSPSVPVVSSKAKAALPLYIYPSPNEENWEKAFDGASQIDFIIANVYNGPGTEKKTSWTNMINKAVAKGIKVYGYVSTDYTRVNGATADKDVFLWFKFYPQISGFFFDETSSGADKLPYYKARYDYVKKINSNLKVVINPGTNTDEGYMNVSDVNVIFESPYSNWLTKRVPAWVQHYPKERFYAIVYEVPTETKMKEVVRAAKERNFGKIFITSADSPSDPLPSYFQAELAEIAK